MTRILLVRAHPDPQRHFADALVEAYAQGASEGGHAVERLDLATLDIPLLRSAADWTKPSTSADMREAQEKVMQAEHLVFVYPLWLGDMPALLKAFLEQVSCAGGMIEMKTPDGRGGWVPKLKGKSARLFVTMGMPGFVYRWYYGAHSLKSFERNILKFAGCSRVRSTVIGSIEGEARGREEALEEARALGRQAG